MTLVAVKDASFSYGKKKVFDGLSFNLEKGEIFCLIGPNGCGKTTFLDCLLGLQAFQSGTYQLMGNDADRLQPRKLARTMAYVPQVHQRTFPYTVREIVIMGRAARLGMFQSPSRTDGVLADEALERIGIGHLSRRPYTQLSGGEVQLVMVARALAQQTPIIVMDEPTAHLDFRYELVVLEVISSLIREKELSIIMSTHFPNHAFYFRNHQIKTLIALLNNGSFMAMGEPEKVIDKNMLKSLYGINAEVISLTDDTGRALKHIVPLHTVGNGDRSNDE